MTVASKRSLKSKSRSRSATAVLRDIRSIKSEVDQKIADMSEQVRQLECLSKFSAILNSKLETDLIRERALEATCELLQCETASLFLVDREKGELYWETALGSVGKELQKQVRLPINDQSLAGYVAMTGESLILNDVAADRRHFKGSSNKTAKTSSSTFQTKTMICVPLIARDRTLGVLQAINKLPQAAGKAQARILKNRTHGWPDFHRSDLELLLSLSHQVAIAVENAQLYLKLKTSFYETVEALTEAIEKKDRTTGGHTKRVVHFSVCIAKYLSLSTEEVDRIKLGAILHDVGKIGIEDKILKKDAPLNDDEWPVMKTHPELGYQIMKRVQGLKDVVGGMRFHHERWDGKGYPLGLKGDEIPMIARVIAVADTYDAMVSTRPYRKGLDPKIAYDEIIKHSGTQFCPTVVEAFKKAFRGEKMGRGSGAGSDAERGAI